jgi:hypothetical protein
VLRVVCEKEIVLENVKVDGENCSIQPVADLPGVFQVELFFVDKPRFLRVELLVNAAAYHFAWDFVKPLSDHGEK